MQQQIGQQDWNQTDIAMASAEVTDVRKMLLVLTFTRTVTDNLRLEIPRNIQVQLKQSLSTPL